MSPEFVTERLSALERHCQALGRDSRSIAKTLLWQGEGCDPDRFLSELVSDRVAEVSRRLGARQG